MSFVSTDKTQKNEKKNDNKMCQIFILKKEIKFQIKWDRASRLFCWQPSPGPKANPGLLDPKKKMSCCNLLFIWSVLFCITTSNGHCVIWVVGLILIICLLCRVNFTVIWFVCDVLGTKLLLFGAPVISRIYSKYLFMQMICVFACDKRKAGKDNKRNRQSTIGSVAIANGGKKRKKYFL